MQPPDPSVHSPPHYTAGGIECIDAIQSSMTREEYLGFLKGNTMKYLWRYLEKDNPAQDLAKAAFYLARLRVEQGENG